MPQAQREIALGLLSRLVRGEASAARAAALYRPAIPLLLDFIETAERQGRLAAAADSSGPEGVWDNPDILGTSMSMLVRAASTLCCLVGAAQQAGGGETSAGGLGVGQGAATEGGVEGRRGRVAVAGFRHQQRLLALVMSPILDLRVTSLLAEALSLYASKSKCG